MTCTSSGAFEPLRLGPVEGLPGKKNEVVYHLPKVLASTRCIVFFGGDMQDYKENMHAHRDNKHYADWDIETTTALLHKQFLDCEIITIKPAKMALKTFSCYENFVEVNNFGAPTYEKKLSGLLHLKLLLDNLSAITKVKFHEFWSTTSPISEHTDLKKTLTLIGFSKGCVVLNQLLYSFHKLCESPESDLESFVRQISDIYWLDGGHSGTASTWITDKCVLNSFSKLPIRIHIHVTPYQVQCTTRPRIGKEEKLFRENLCRMGMNVTRKLYFESEPRTIENHFKVLVSFSKNET